MKSQRFSHVSHFDTLRADWTITQLLYKKQISDFSAGSTDTLNTFNSLNKLKKRDCI